MDLAEKCRYCNKEYIPKRRGAQKFCSNTCRSKNWKHNQQRSDAKIAKSNETIKTLEKKPIPTDKINIVGIGNAAIGVATVEAVKGILTPENKKNATKADINKLITMMSGQRYFPIKNIAKNIYGNSPFYDIETEEIVYLKLTF